MTVQLTPQFSAQAKPVEQISLLDENGKLRPKAKPKLNLAETLEALRMMMLGRIFDQKCFSLQRQGKMGTFAPIFGQEAALVGSALALEPSRDWIVPQYREMPVQVHHGISMEMLALYRRGHPAGNAMPDGVNAMLTQVSLAAQIPHAVGLAWGLRLQDKDGVVAVYFGEGSSSEGDFHESCNLAGVVGAPVIFMLQNNNWAISTPRANQSNATDLAARAVGYGIAGVSVDGNDLFAVHAVMADAVARGRAGKGATLIEAHTYRMGVHTTADDPTRYVDSDELESWKPRDPIARVQKYLASKGKWNDKIAATWTEEIAAEVEEVFVRVDATPPPDKGEIYKHIFAELTPALRRQRAEHFGDS